MTRLASAGKIGIFCPADERWCVNTGSTMAVADLVVVDTGSEGTPTPTNYRHGYRDSAMAGVVLPSDLAGLQFDRFGFFGGVKQVKGGGVAGQDVLVVFNGEVDLNVTEDDGAAGVAPVGRPIYADLTDAEGHVDANSLPASKKLIGMTTATVAQGATAITSVHMWGIAGIGHS
jgi:hypothetical protein